MNQPCALGSFIVRVVILGQNRNLERGLPTTLTKHKRSAPMDEHDSQRDRERNGEREHAQRGEAARGPAALRAAQRREELRALLCGLSCPRPSIPQGVRARLRIRIGVQLVIFVRQRERREEHARACDPEEGEH